MDVFLNLEYNRISHAVSPQALKEQPYFCGQQVIKLPENGAVHDSLPDGFGIQPFLLPQGDIASQAVLVQLAEILVVDILYLAGADYVVWHKGFIQPPDNVQGFLLLLFRQGHGKFQKKVCGRPEYGCFHVVAQDESVVMEKCLVQMFPGFLKGNIGALHTAYNRSEGYKEVADLYKLLGQKTCAVVQGLVHGPLRGVKEDNNAVVPPEDIGLGYAYGREIIHKIIPDTVHGLLRQCGQGSDTVNNDAAEKGGMGNGKAQVSYQLACLCQILFSRLGQQEAKVAQLFLFLKPGRCLAHFLVPAVVHCLFDGCGQLIHVKGLFHIPQGLQLDGCFQVFLI